MNVRMDTNAAELGRAMQIMARDQLPFAAAMAVRATALDVQAGQREHQRSVFQVRRKAFVDRAVKIRDWPTKDDPTAIVRIEPPGGPARAQMLIDHEEGGTRLPVPGRRARSVEQAVRTSPNRIAPKRLRPRSLDLQRVGGGGGGGPEVFRGRLKTFMIRWPDGSGAIFRRVGPSTPGDPWAGTEVLWSMAPGGVELEPTLNFYGNAERIVAEMWPRRMSEWWDRAIRSAR